MGRATSTFGLVREIVETNLLIHIGQLKNLTNRIHWVIRVDGVTLFVSTMHRGVDARMNGCRMVYGVLGVAR